MMIDLAKAVPIEDEVAQRGGLGLKRIGGELIGPCPQCGGRDRFAVSIRKQIFLCRGCGRSGDVIAFVQHLDCADFKTAVQTLAGDERKPVAPVRLLVTSTHDDNSERALRLWNDASPIAGTIAEVYLHGRKLHDLPGADVLRFLKRCPFDGVRQDCLISLYRNIITNAPQAICRTAIDSSGTKIERLSLGPVKGAGIKIDPDENIGQGLTISEGLESGLAGRQLGFRPCWATGSAGGIRNFPVLPGIEALTILVDHDPADQRGRQAGQEAARECSHRWISAGCEVRRIMPRRQGADMADLAEVVS
jgi:phage/plasmid primase-like uncharacterized protein